jgi:hypothetical protein
VRLELRERLVRLRPRNAGLARKLGGRRAPEPGERGVQARLGAAEPEQAERVDELGVGPQVDLARRRW